MRTERTHQYYWRSKDYTPVPYDPINLAYMAGIIDGEGCFFIGMIPKSGWYVGQLKIDNTDQKLIDWINTVFPGISTSNNRWTSKRTFERQIFSWVSAGDRLLNLCEQVLPYLVIKKTHCENMIKFRKSYSNRTGNKPVTDDIKAIRQECLEASRKLNSRYHLHPLKGNL